MRQEEAEVSTVCIRNGASGARSQFSLTAILRAYIPHETLLQWSLDRPQSLIQYRVELKVSDVQPRCCPATQAEMSCAYVFKNGKGFARV